LARSPLNNRHIRERIRPLAKASGYGGGEGTLAPAVPSIGQAGEACLGVRPCLKALSGERWDVIIIGGGITGAGALLEAARRGYKALLLEQKDFAWGASSRSSKMVHGGLRYLPQGHFRLTRDALRERERMIRELPDLVHRQPYAFVLRRGQFPGRWPMEMVLALYDALAGIRDHHWLGRDALSKRIPQLATNELRGAMIYTDAVTEDARLVLRILHEAKAEGARLCNYAEVTAVKSEAGHFAVMAAGETSGETHRLTARAVINATGPWAGQLTGEPRKIRPLRGSHLLVRREALPVDDCVTLMHPKDKRPVFIYPWLGMTVIGTTDLDQSAPLSEEPRCTQAEVDYLFEAVRSLFPAVPLKAADIVSTMAGVRPVVASGKGIDPSKESREHSIWTHDGMVCVAGGKLTTFRLIALDALHAAGLIGKKELASAKTGKGRLFRHKITFPEGLGEPLAPVAQGDALLASLDWALENEMVVHLDDLLLRRVRAGNTTPEGGRDLLPRIRPLCQKRLGWDDRRWVDEETRYLDIVKRFYGLPEACPQ
jgi:glycerol-3-phosphate dehydrogenase